MSGSIDHAALYKCQIKYSPLDVQPGRSVCVCVCVCVLIEHENCAVYM